MRLYARHRTPTLAMCLGGLAAKDTSSSVRSVVGCGSLGHYVMLTPHTQAAREREDVIVWFPVHLQWSSSWHYSADSSNGRRNEGMWLQRHLWFGFMLISCDLRAMLHREAGGYLHVMSIKYVCVHLHVHQQAWMRHYPFDLNLASYISSPLPSQVCQSGGFFSGVLATLEMLVLHL